MVDWTKPQPSYEELFAKFVAAQESLAEWQKAYEELLSDFRRLEVQANAMRFKYEAAEAAVTFEQRGAA